MKLILLLLSILFAMPGNIISQNCSTMNIRHQADVASSCNQMVMTMIHDVSGRPFLYVANKEAGLKIYDISSISSVNLVKTIPTSAFDTLDVMNLSQEGNYVYLALGNSFTNPQKGGMAIVDISNPLAAFVTDYYVVPNSNSGGGIVKTEGNYAYFGAMKSGLVILDITNKNNIQFVSLFLPDINFPPIPNPNPNYYNARGMEVKNSIVYLCYDGGGIRIINCKNKNAPVETGHYCNPLMFTPFDHPKAYNNVVLDGSLLYVAVDYCGMEILNISDTANIVLEGWWNPYDCPNNNWFSSPVHSNEIFYNKKCNQVFLSTGKSDMMVVDVSDPSHPDSCNYYGGVSNNIGSWGIGSYKDQIYLSYVCAIIPFPSNWTGFKIITYDTCLSTSIDEQKNNFLFSVFPNPCNGMLSIDFPEYPGSNTELIIADVSGRTLFRKTPVSSHEVFTLNLNKGLYFYRFTNKYQTVFTGKLVME
jgi:hypothetical protein